MNSQVSLTCRRCDAQFFYTFNEEQDIQEVRCDECKGNSWMQYTTPRDLAKRRNIKFSAEEVPSRPDNLMGDMARHFRCRIANGRNSFRLYFSQGEGIKRDPEVSDVLDCLASDASGFENSPDFEDWAAEYGYDTDSRSAEKIFNSVRRQSEQLKRVIGDTAYDELLWHTGRL